MKKKRKHTRTPWTVDGSTIITYQTKDSLCKIGICETNKFPRWMYTPPLEQQIANLELIARTPKMYAILKDLCKSPNRLGPLQKLRRFAYFQEAARKLIADYEKSIER